MHIELITKEDLDAFRQALLRDIAGVFNDFMHANKTVSTKIKTQIHK